jgi:hypothetical protein
VAWRESGFEAGGVHWRVHLLPFIVCVQMLLGGTRETDNEGELRAPTDAEAKAFLKEMRVRCSVMCMYRPLSIGDEEAATSRECGGTARRCDGAQCADVHHYRVLRWWIAGSFSEGAKLFVTVSVDLIDWLRATTATTQRKD